MMLDYEKIEKSLRGLPITWYPALLKTIIEEAIEKKVFREGMIHIFVREAENMINDHNKDILSKLEDKWVMSTILKRN